VWCWRVMTRGRMMMVMMGGASQKQQRRLQGANAGQCGEEEEDEVHLHVVVDTSSDSLACVCCRFLPADRLSRFRF
jgi:hypothetical protein